MTEEHVPVPAWLTSKIDQRLALMEQAGVFDVGLEDYSMILTPLSDPNPLESVTEWDRTCDRCGTFVEDEGEFWTGQVTTRHKGHHVTITYGVCGPCKRTAF